MDEVEKFFGDAAAIVDRILVGLVPPETEEPARLHAAMRWSLFGSGKRFRPALAIASGRHFGADDGLLGTCAAAIEMIHTYSLIHDDLPAMDDDDLRRGRATCHIKFGEATAILAGDALQVLAFNAISRDETLSPDVRLELVSGLSKAAGKMVSGQQEDLEAEGKEVTAADVERIHRNKTGALIQFSAEAGAVIGKADAHELSVIRDFGAKIGLLFQITDDILDITESTEMLGKTAAKDLTAEKATYPSVYGMDGAQRLLADTRDAALEDLSRLSKPSPLLSGIVDHIANRRS